MIPNLLPILLTLGLMPMLGIPIDVGTVMIASVALGLVVDDTIHFLYRLKLEIKQTQEIKSAINDTIHITGRAIILASLALSLGFLALLFASFKPVFHFGILSGIVILLALAFDLIVLPAILGLTGKRMLRG